MRYRSMGSVKIYYHDGAVSVKTNTPWGKVANGKIIRAIQEIIIEETKVIEQNLALAKAAKGKLPFGRVPRPWVGRVLVVVRSWLSRIRGLDGNGEKTLKG